MTRTWGIGVFSPLVTVICVVLFGLLAGFTEVSAARISGDTYCVGPRGNPDSCNSSEVKKQHHPSCWHDHGEALHGPGNAYTDGTFCYVCYDECDSTCDLVFLRDHDGWRVVPEGLCGGRLPWAPLSEGLKHHVIDGKALALPPPPPPAEPQDVVLTTEVSAASAGPFAVGDTVELGVALLGPDGRPRPFGRGSLIVRDDSGEEISRQDVDASGKQRGVVRLVLQREGELQVEFAPEVSDIALGAGERLTMAPKISPLGIEVASCTYRARLIDPPSVALPGRALPLTVWILDGKTGQPVSPADYRGPGVNVRLHVPGADDVSAIAQVEDNEWHVSLEVPDLSGGEVNAQLTASGTAAGVALCPESVSQVALAPLGVSLSVIAPQHCYLTKDCEVSWTVHSPGSGPGADLARTFLRSAEVAATVGGSPIELQGSVASGTFTARVTPEHVGMAHFRLELRGEEAVAEATATTEVRSDIVLSLPETLDLGVLSGGVDWEDTCVALDLSAPGNRGALLTSFVVELEEASDCACEGTPTIAMTVAGAGETGLWVQPVGEDSVTLPGLYPFEARGALQDNEELAAAAGSPVLAVCLAGLGRCPSEGGGEGRTLVIRPAVPEFADQVARVRLSYRIEGRSFLACWGDLVSLLALGLLGLVVLYGFIWPHSFSSFDRIRIAGDARSLARAPKVPLRQFPAGRRGWYRSGRASVGAGGARVRSPRRAVFVVRASSAGPLLTARGPVRVQNSRTRRSEVIEGAGEGILMRSGVVYEVADLFVRMG